jgi:hypothetical protein
MEVSIMATIDFAKSCLCFRWPVHLVCWDFVICFGSWFLDFCSLYLVSTVGDASFFISYYAWVFRLPFLLSFFFVRHIVGIQGGCCLDLGLVTWTSDIFLGNKVGGMGVDHKITILLLLTGMRGLRTLSWKVVDLFY